MAKAGHRWQLLEQATVVTSAAELKEAVTQGLPHIEIRQHLDLRDGAPAIPASPGQALPGRRLQDVKQKPPILGTVKAALRAIRGNCTTSGPIYEASLQQSPHASDVDMPLDKPQHLLEERVAQSTPCILRLDASLLVAHSQLWLDGLHLDVQRAEAEMYAFESLYVIEILPARPHWPELPALWMTDVAVVGNIHVFEKKEVSINGLLAIDTTVLLERCLFSGLGGYVPPVQMVDSKASFVDCMFLSNILAFEAQGIIVGYLGSVVVLRGPVFSDNTGYGQMLLGYDEVLGNESLSTFFTDDGAVKQYCRDGVDLVPIPPTVQGSSDAISNLTSMEMWLRGFSSAAGVINRTARLIPSGSFQGDNTLNSLGRCNIVANSSLEGAEEGTPGSGLSVSASVFAAVAATSAALVLVLLAGSLLWHWQRRTRSAETGEGHMPPSDKARSCSKAAVTSSSLDHGNRTAPVDACAGIAVALPACEEDDVGSVRMRAPLHPATHMQTAGSSSAWTTLPLTPQAAPQVPDAGATVKERLHYISQQLDAFGRRAVILKQFEMLGGDDRCIGGQAVVQFVRAPRNNHLYAIKLFASRAAYKDEKHLYVNFFPGFMPTVVQFVDNEDGSFRDPFGNPMPPCFVMEKGESLTERTMRRKSDIFTTVQIIGQVASCLAELHGQGWVHRDLKPGNIMYLPRTASWTLIDFGLAARIEETACLGFTLAYAAPEVIVAAHQGSKSATADAAVDAWALGVMAFELLTGRPIYCKLTDSSADLERQLRGEEPLPWEGDRLTADTKRRLGAIRAPVLRMLCRDPVQRASCKDLAAALRAVFSGSSTADPHGRGMHAQPV